MKLRAFLSSLGTLQWALIASVAVHAALLGVRVADPERFNRIFRDTPLEVVLVNAHANEKPAQAQAIAQANLAGGGEADSGRASSPLPPSAFNDTGESTEEARQQLQAMQSQQMLLLAQAQQQLATLPAAQPDASQSNPNAVAKEEKRRQLVALLAEIERRINDENARPKKRYISPATREAVYAAYYDSLRRRIEDRGTQNFPELAGRKLYGELTMIVTVNHDGRVLQTEVVESSGNALLDRRAQAITRAAGPFGRFNEAMRRQADQIMVVSRFRFNRDETLETKLGAP